MLTRCVGCPTGEQGGGTALMEAADGGHTDVVRLLLDRGANIQRAQNVSTGARLAEGGGYRCLLLSLCYHYLLAIYLSIYYLLLFIIYPIFNSPWVTSGLGSFLTCYDTFSFYFARCRHIFLSI